MGRLFHVEHLQTASQKVFHVKHFSIFELMFHVKHSAEPWPQPEEALASNCNPRRGTRHVVPVVETRLAASLSHHDALTQASVSSARTYSTTASLQPSM